MKKYAKKYAKKRQALGYDKLNIKNALIMIDPNGQEEKQEESVQVVTNKLPEETIVPQQQYIDPVETPEPPTPPTPPTTPTPTPPTIPPPTTYGGSSGGGGGGY